jgi:hypothetical protein
MGAIGWRSGKSAATAYRMLRVCIQDTTLRVEFHAALARTLLIRYPARYAT